MNKHLKTLLLGIYAGLAIALGGLLNIVAGYLLRETPELARVVGSLLFPVGLTLVCFLGLNLFTGKIGYVLDNKKDYWGFLGLVYLGNLIGSLIFGGICLAIFKNTKLYGKALAVSAGKLVKVEFLPIFKMLVFAAFCGMLVYAAVFCYKTFKKTWLKVVGIFLPIALFVYLKFDHCIANMFYFTFAWDWDSGLSYLNIAVVTIGNSLGAIVLNEGVKAFKKLFVKNEEKSI